MEFRPLEFPRCIAMGAQVSPGWNTTLTQVFNGGESTNQNWSQARNSYDVGIAVRTASDYEVMRAHFHSVRGRAFSFPFQDPLDHTVLAAEGGLLDDGDSPTTGYHLAKRYGPVPYHYDRRITRPEQGSVAIYRLRGGVTTTITGSATINYSTGWVTFTGGTVVSGDVISWAGRFLTPCRYDTDRLPSVIVDKEPGQDGELLVECPSVPIFEVREIA